MGLESCGLIDVNGFANWGTCFRETVFFGDMTIATIGVIAMLAYVAYKMRMPHEASFTLGIGVVFMMAIVFPSPGMNSLVAITVMAISIYIVRGIIKPAKR